MKRDWVNGIKWMRAATWVGASLAVGMVAGCAGSKPVQFSDSAADASELALPSVGAPPASSGVQHVQTYHNDLAKTLDNSEDQSAWSKATSSFRKATDSIKESLTIHPKVVPAQDPLSLSSGQGSIDPSVFFSLAGVYEGQGQLDLAVQQYKKGLDADPSNVNGWIKFARMYDRQGDYRQAKMAYRRVLELAPDHPTALNDLGLCHARNGEFEQALASLERAVSLAPDKRLYRNNIATVLVAQGRFDEALQQLQVVHEPAAAQYNLAVLLLKENRGDLAVAHLQSALRADPNLAPARELLNGLGRYAGGVQAPFSTAVNPYAAPSQPGPPQARWQPAGQPTPATPPQQSGPGYYGPTPSAADNVPTYWPPNGGSSDAHTAQQLRLLPPTEAGYR